LNLPSRIDKDYTIPNGKKENTRGNLSRVVLGFSASFATSVAVFMHEEFQCEEFQRRNPTLPLMEDDLRSRCVARYPSLPAVKNGVVGNGVLAILPDKYLFAPHFTFQSACPWAL